MGKILSVHSFRGGTGKSNLTANLAAALALTSQTGLRIGIVDTDIQSPGIHLLFQLTEANFNRALNDYLWSQCAIEDTAYEVTPPQLRERANTLYLIPSSMKAGEIARVIREGYDVNRLTDGFQDIIDILHLDYLLIDTHPGLNEETLLALAISDMLILLLRPDRQDFQGTAVTVEVARKLGVPELLLVINKTLPTIDHDALRQRVEDTYLAPVAAMLPLSQEMLQLASGGLFLLHYPEHPMSESILQLARRVQNS